MNEKYQCCNCQATGVKLWRWAARRSTEMLCMACAESATDSVCELRPEITEYRRGRRNPSDHIGNMVLAVPSDCELPSDATEWQHAGAWWGYTSIPRTGVDWWFALPLAKETP